MTAGSTLTIIFEFLTNPPRLWVKSLTSPVSLYMTLMSMIKKLAKTKDTLVGSTQVSRKTAPVSARLRDKRLISRAETVRAIPRLILR
jgi:hypothetical protein